MEEFRLSLKDSLYWFSSRGEIHELIYHASSHIPARDVWVISCVRFDKDNKIVHDRRASIIALEKIPNKTTIQFIDGINLFSDPTPDIPNSVFPLYRKKFQPIGNSLDELAEEIRKRVEQSNLIPNDNLPPKEPQSRSLEDWFDYFYLMKSTRWKFDMQFIADKTNYSINTIYKEHTLYKIRHGIKRKVLVRKSRKR